MRPCSFLFFTLFTSTILVSSSVSSSPQTPYPSDAVSLLSFKSKADLDNKLLYTLHERFDYCSWQGVKCGQGRVVRVVLQGFGLRGQFPPDTLNQLDQLRVLSLKNNSLTGPIPDLSRLVNLKSLVLDQNSFSDTFPSSLLSLHRLLILDLSHNNFTGSLPSGLTVLDRLNCLRLDSNRFDGSIPPLNQSSLVLFNVSNNNLTGPVPVTPTLKKFTVSSFIWNPNLCGEVINKPCRSSPFFDNSPSAAGVASPPTPLVQNSQAQGDVSIPSPSHQKHKRVGIILGFIIGVFLLIAAVLCIFAIFKRCSHHDQDDEKKTKLRPQETVDNEEDTEPSMEIADIEDEIVKEKKTYQVTDSKNHKQLKSGNLVFCNG